MAIRPPVRIGRWWKWFLSPSYRYQIRLYLGSLEDYSTSHRYIKTAREKGHFSQWEHELRQQSAE